MQPVKNYGKPVKMSPIETQMPDFQEQQNDIKTPSPLKQNKKKKRAAVVGGVEPSNKRLTFNLEILNSMEKHCEKNDENEKKPTQSMIANIYQDDTKLVQALRMHSTLDDRFNGVSQTDQRIQEYNDELSDMYLNVTGPAGSDSQAGNSSAQDHKSLIFKFERLLVHKVFEMNFAILNHQVINVTIYHVIMLFDFLQLLFFIFYGVSISNEYIIKDAKQDIAQVDKNASTPTNSSLIESTQYDLYVGNKDGQSSALRLDSYLQVFNFQLYAFTNKVPTPAPFYYTYIAVVGGFTAIIGVFILVCSSIIERLRQDNLKEGTKLILRIFSVIMCLLITIFQIPITTVLLQGFLCEENLEVEYTLAQIQCSGQDYKILVSCSSVFLIFYYIFIVIQVQLYSSSNFDSTVPWSCFLKKVNLIKVFQKFILSIVFVFNKHASSSQGVFHLFCMILSLYVIKRRIGNALYFIKSVHFASLTYEIMFANLAFLISIQRLGNESPTLSSIFLLGFFAMLFMGLIYVRQEKARIKLIMIDDVKDTLREEDYELYFFRMHEMIKENTKESQILVLGLLYNHVQLCPMNICQAVTLIESIDNVKRYRKEKKLHEEEVKHQNMSFDSEQLQERLGLVSFYQTKGPGAETIGFPQWGATQGSPSVESLSKIGGGCQIKSANTLNQTLGPQDTPACVHEPAEFMLDLDERFAYDAEKVHQQVFKFLGIKINKAILQFPQNIELRILNSFFQRARLHNNFKSVFELMSSENCGPTINQKFTIYKRKIEIEQQLVKQHDKSILKIGYLDVSVVLAYERAFQKFQLNEYLAVRAAIGFWRELLQAEMSSSLLHKRGIEVSRSYHNIQEAAQELQKIYPEDIKFLFKYGVFLIKIINNEYDGIDKFHKAQAIYQSKITQQVSSAASKNEQAVFGENSGAGVVVVSATSNSFGTIIHANEELEHVLGYSRVDLIERNINYIMPPLISKNHNRLFQRYLETGKSAVIDKIRQVFIVNKSGYMQLTQILIKVHPQIDGRILFVGLLKKTSIFNEMTPVKTDYLNFEQHYIMTDDEGYITNITDGLLYELGLHASFFQSRSSAYQTMIPIKSLCSNIDDEEVLFKLEHDTGAHLAFDTTQILQNVEVEQISSEDLQIIRSNLSRQKAHVTLKKMSLGGRICSLHVYRLIFLNSHLSSNDVYSSKASQLLAQYLHRSGQMAQLQGKSIEQQNNNIINQLQLLTNEQKEGFSSHVQNDIQSEQASISSNASSGQYFDNVIKTFKHSLEDKSTPRTLANLNIIMVIVCLCMIALTAVDFSILNQVVSSLAAENIHNLNSERRTLSIVMISSNIRSLINVASNMEYDKYLIPELNRFSNRFEYLERTILIEQEDLFSIHQFLTKQRTDNDAGDNVLQNQFEYEPIALYRVDEQNRVQLYYLPYRVSMIEFLNNILMLNATEEEDIQLPKDLITYDIDGNFRKKYANISYLEKQAYFMYTNGLRSLRTRTYESMIFQQAKRTEGISSSPFFTLMIIGMIMGISSICVLLFQIWQIEKIQGNILSLYAHLTSEQILEIYYQCSKYMSMLIEGSFMKMIRGGSQENAEDVEDLDASINDEFLPPIFVAGSARDLSVQKNSSHEVKMNSNSGNKRDKIMEVQMLDEEDENSDQEENKFGSKEGGNQARSPSGSPKRQRGDAYQANGGSGTFKSPQCIYTIMIKRTIRDIKIINAIKGGETRKSIRSSMSYHGGASGLSSSSAFLVQPVKSKAFLKAGLNQSKGGGNDVSVKEEEQEEEQEDYEESEEEEESKTDSLQDEFFEEENEKKQQTPVQRKSAEASKDRNPAKNHSNKTAMISNIHEGKKDAKRDSKLNRKRMSRMAARKSIANSKRMENEIFKMQQKQLEQEQYVQERKEQFQKTMATQNLSRKFLTALVCFCISTYFLQLHFYHEDFLAQILILQQCIPCLFNRMRFVMLGYNLMRERIIFNNSLRSFEEDSVHGNNIDLMYIEHSIENEQKLIELKQDYPSILKPIVEFLNTADSPEFCEGIIGQTKSVSSLAIEEQKSTSPQVSYTNFKSYQDIISTTVAACVAAYNGQLGVLVDLHVKGVDFTKGDYDGRTPLHYGVRGWRQEVVQYLMDIGIDPNPKDRWESTPLNYAINPDIAAILKKKGGARGENTTLEETSLYPRTWNMTDNDFRLFYAAMNDDTKTEEALFLLGWKINIQDIDGRTPLMLAARYGCITSVKYFAQKGADLTIFDYRDECAMDNAESNGFIETHNFIDNIISENFVKNNCLNFASGLFKQGIHSAIGAFHKKFADMQIKIASLDSASARLKLLKGEQYDSEGTLLEDHMSKDLTPLQLFEQTQELFLTRIVQLFDEKIVSTYNAYSSKYSAYTSILFTVFLALQLFTLFYLRNHLMHQMSQDIFESRGILNLIPNHVIERNKLTVESIIKTLRG